jgi:hypothetical protein
MLVRDGHVECWLPEELIDLSEVSFTEPGRRPLIVRGVVLGPLSPHDALAADLDSARAGMTAFDPAAAPKIRQDDFAVDGSPASRAVLETAGRSGIFQGTAYVKTSDDGGVHLLTDAPLGSVTNPKLFEDEFDRVEQGLFLASTSRPVAAPPGRALRVFGRLGLSLAERAVAIGRYRYRGHEEPALVVGVQQDTEPTLLDLEYTTPRDTVRSIEKRPVPRSVRSSATREEEWWERVEITRPSRHDSPGGTDEHLVRRFASHRVVVTPGLPTSIFAIVAAPASRRAHVDAFWDRITGSCRHEGTP